MNFRAIIERICYAICGMNIGNDDVRVREVNPFTSQHSIIATEAAKRLRIHALKLVVRLQLAYSVSSYAFTVSASGLTRREMELAVDSARAWYLQAGQHYEAKE
jgi:hypothetical protein